MGIELPLENKDNQGRLLICFLHDHLRSVMTVQSTIIESAILGDEFFADCTVSRLREVASIYQSYAEQIESAMRKSMGKIN